MKNDLIFIVQKCICIDFLINAIISSNIYNHLNFLTDLKKENLKNIKVMCNLYKCTYNDELLLKNTPSIRLDKNIENNLNTLLLYSLDILTKVDILKKQYSQSYYKNIFKGLYDSYFNLISYINCFCPLSSNTYANVDNIENKYLNLGESNNFPIFFKILNSSINKLQFNNKINLIRDICIEAIYLFFSYSITDDLIVDEYYEIFFENNPENKFYQFFFKLDVGSFKVRIYDKSLVVFYIYQTPKNIINIFPPLNKDNSKLLVDMYLEEKFKDDFNN
ncbi:hypothetical protein, partial [Romboutsia sp. 13368]|uniref:hypothetical protein n=1 Tax=Romboutsia sp. 13368 TaxID=2708053 RepID=UPI0025E10C01